MFKAQKNKFHSSIYVDDSVVRYCVLGNDENGFFVVHHDEASLPQGVIVSGEVLKAQAFKGILESIESSIALHIPKGEKSKTSLLLPSKLFSSYSVTVPDDILTSKKKGSVESFLQENKKDHPWVEKGKYSYRNEPEDSITYFEVLASEIFSTYHMLMDEAGFSQVSITSDIASMGYFTDLQKMSLLIVFGDDSTRAINMSRGHVLETQNFELSYQQFVEDIVKNLGIEDEQALDIVRKYGVSRSHLNEKVYQRIMRSVTPLVDFLRKKKTIKKTPVYLWYLNTPIVGMSDLLSKRLGTAVVEIDSLNHPLFRSHDVQSLHRNDSHRFSHVLAHSMVSLS